MIPAGKYTARGVEGQLTTSQEKGTPCVQVLVRITQGEHEGETLRWDGWLTDATEQRTLESLRYLGWSTDMLDDLRGIDANEVQIVVEHESYEKDGQTKTFPRCEGARAAVRSEGARRAEGRLRAGEARQRQRTEHGRRRRGLRRRVWGCGRLGYPVLIMTTLTDEEAQRLRTIEAAARAYVAVRRQWDAGRVAARSEYDRLEALERALGGEVRS